MAQESRREYAQRMHRVQEYIDAHLDANLDLATLAEVAHFSAFHFHRLFAAWMGETLGDYLRRRRLEWAAVRLIGQPDTPVLDIALGVGFGSAEAFARAFKTRFGVSATVFREQQAQQRIARPDPPNSNPGQANGNPDQALTNAFEHHGASTNAMEPAMEVKVVDRKPVKIAYMRYIGPYGQPVADFWQQSFAPWMIAHGLMGAARYGIAHDDPAITAPEKCHYDACVEVPADFTVVGALSTTLPAGMYACTPYYGNGADIAVPWQALLRDWLPASGMQLDSRPFLEYYPVGARYDPQTGSFECELCIPVTTL
ncbi:MAG: transcriptional regulator [Betaproteobacteria bacterium]|nr:transcriptional regulator [Betaproteobacteria bacterium]